MKSSEEYASAAEAQLDRVAALSNQLHDEDSTDRTLPRQSLFAQGIAITAQGAQVYATLALAAATKEALEQRASERMTPVAAVAVSDTGQMEP